MPEFYCNRYGRTLASFTVKGHWYFQFCSSMFSFASNSKWNLFSWSSILYSWAGTGSLTQMYRQTHKHTNTHLPSSIRTYKTQHVPTSRLSLLLKHWVCLAGASCVQDKLIFKTKITVMLSLVTPVRLLSHWLQLFDSPISTFHYRPQRGQGSSCHCTLKIKHTRWFKFPWAGFIMHYVVYQIVLLFVKQHVMCFRGTGCMFIC